MNNREQSRSIITKEVKRKKNRREEIITVKKNVQCPCRAYITS